MRLLDKEVAVSEAVSVRGQPYTASVESIMNLDINCQGEVYPDIIQIVEQRYRTGPGGYLFSGMMGRG